MRKLFLLFWALLATTCLWAHDFVVDGIYYNYLDDNNVEVTYRGDYVGSYEEYSGEVAIPETVTYNGTTYSVTSIGDGAFYECTALTSVTIGNSVTSIGGSAFWDCSSLTSIVIPDGVTSIEDCTFAACSSLTSINIPNSVTSIEFGTFQNCSSLTSVTIGNSVTSIGSYAFDGCSSLTSITIPNSVTSIGEWAFYNCISLTSPVYNAHCFAYMPPSFEGAYTIPDGIKQIAVGAFYKCSKLTFVTIPNSVTSIGSRAFYSCSSLTSVTIGNSVTSIGERAFEGTNFTSFICNSTGLTSFGCSFSEQPLLDTIIAPAAFFDVKEADWSSSPKHIKYARVISGELTENAFGVINRSYKTLTVLDLAAVTNTTIADEAFKGCYNLDSLYLPSNLTYIPYMAVADCKSLKSITIPASVEEIDNSAFENCRLLSEVNFAEDGALTEIGNWAFYNCHELKNVVIPEGVTNVGYAAFYGCTYLKELTLPASMQSVADNGFALCEKLAKMNVNAVVPPVVDARTFENVDRMIPVVVPTESVAAYKSAPVWQEFNIQGKDNVESDLENIGSDNGYGVMDNGKILRNGQLIIIRDGVEYNVMGQQL